jgi:hypothetical protein
MKSMLTLFLAYAGATGCGIRISPPRVAKLILRAEILRRLRFRHALLNVVIRVAVDGDYTHGAIVIRRGICTAGLSVCDHLNVLRIS